MFVHSRIDQLRVHAHLAAGTLHAAFQHVSDAKLLSDFAQIARATRFINYYRSAADYLQVCDLCKITQNLVLDTIGEKSVFLFRTQVFKG